MLRRSVQLLHSAKLLHCLTKLQLNPNTVRVLYSTYDRDFPNPSLPTPASKLYSHDTDILLEQIRKARTIDRLLELTSMHLQVMNVRHVVETMHIIHDLSKDSRFTSDLLLENETFRGLCSRLMKIVRLLDVQDVITVYKALSGLGVRNNTYVAQSVLKMMGSHLNNMTLGQLTFIYFLLSKQKPNSLVDGLKLALPLVLQVQIEQQLDSDNITEIVSSLQLACKARIKPIVIEKVLAALIQKAKLMTPANALGVAFSLLNLDTPVDGYKKLINYSFDVLSVSTDSINQKQTQSLVRVCRNRNYYNSRFLFAIANKIISEKWNFEQTYEIVLQLYKLSFAPQNLLDYFVDALCSESDSVKTNLLFSPLTCVEYLTLTGYHPPRLQEALEVLYSNEEKILGLYSKSPNLLLKFLSCLSMLGYFPRSELGKILNEDSLFDSWSYSKKQGRSNDFEINIAALVWSLQVYNQEQNFTFPPLVLKRLVTTIYKKHADFQRPLENFIVHGLGGTQFLQSGVFTNDGIFIDHVLAMRSGNYPVALYSSSFNKVNPEMPDNLIFLEDITLPEDAKIITIIVAREDKYCKDPEVLKGWMDIKIKCLMKKKYCPVVINYAQFLNLPDREKIPFLMNEIKNTVEEEVNEKSNSFR